ncbi:Tafazzin [Fasciola gigantica]|uniref:Tafazzin family protein n=1 Tax=Fasciola gigantica TaxID=46835 RepID=A0A504ZCY9_FASGI|nr:Tafazzin [Fasciola gigantica]
MDLVYKLNNHSSVSAFTRRVFQRITYPIFGAIVKLAVWRHNLQIIGRDHLMEAYKRRPLHTPLITISNHHSCLDDFILFGTLLSLFDLMHVDRYRWSLAAVDVCFTNARDCFFFTWGQGVPVWRRVRHPKTKLILHPGGGLYQPSMDFCLNLLNRGKWVHMYPQGRVIQPYERHQEDTFRLRWGVGRLIAECREDPVVLPIWHCGFDELNPSDPPNIRSTLSRILGRPRCLTVQVGEAVRLDAVRQQVGSPAQLAQQSEASRSQVYAHVTQVVQDSLYSLKHNTEKTHSQRLKTIRCSN